MECLAKRPNVCILLVFGIPGAGKSTLSGKVKESLQSEIPCTINVIHVCYDEVIPEETERASIDSCSETSLWKQNRRKVVECVESLLTHYSTPYEITATVVDAVCDTSPINPDVVNNFLKIIPPLRMASVKHEQTVILIDDNMYYQSMRYEYYQLARKYGTAFCEVLVTCPVESALQRNSTRPNNVPDDVIISMATKLQPPRPVGNAWEVNSSVVDTELSSDHVDRVVCLIRRAFEDPVAPLIVEDIDALEASREICSKNQVHQADQIMRKIISRQMLALKGASKDVMKSKAFELNAKRMSALSGLKTGIIRVPQTGTSSTTLEDSTEFYGFIESVFLS